MTLSYAEKQRIRGMLADKQSAKTIALEFEVGEADVLALAKPKAALSAYMCFARENRDAISQEVGATDTSTLSKVIGERWGEVTDRSRWERQAADDRVRHDREMATYQAGLNAEDAAEKARIASAASGPSDRELERAEKRQRLQEEVEERAAAPKKERKAKVLTQAEQTLVAQNKEIESDKAKSAKQRLNFLLGQSDLFKHFGLAKEADASAKARHRKRKTEKEEDEEMMKDHKEEAGGGGSSSAEPPPGPLPNPSPRSEPPLLRAQVRIVSQPGIINKDHGNMRAYQARKLTGPYLVLAPKSTLTNWEREFKNWAPCFKTLLFHGDKEARERMLAENLQPDKFEVCITSYEMIIREANAFRKFSWRYIIVDEAHRMKNEESKLSQVLRSFSSHSRLLITGTPMQNNLHELWALLNFLLPDIFTSADDFNSWFDITDKQVEQEVISQLHKVLKPFLLRRVKADVEGSIPPKTELIVYTQLSPMQRDQYKNILKRDMDALYSSSSATLAQNKSRLMNLVMQLRKCCNHPYLFEGVEDKSLPPFGDHLVTNAGKMALLDKLLMRLKSQGSRDYCAYRHEDGFYYCRIDGSTGGPERQEMIDAFNKPNSDRFLFLLSTRAGGLGINLQTADTVIIYDSDWNPQADLQARTRARQSGEPLVSWLAMDRAHRIGQKKEVKVFRFVTQDSIEEKVVERAEQKLQMDYAVIQQGRLAEKQKALRTQRALQGWPRRALSKEEALAAVRYGADKIFRAGDSVTEEDIDTILAGAKNLTAERSQKLESKEKRDLLDFSNAEVNFQEFEGVDYKSMAQQGDREFIEMMQDSMGKRERTSTVSYNERDAYRGAGASSSKPPTEPGQPKRPKVPDMKDYQLFNVQRINELHEAEYQRELKRTKAASRLSEAGQEVPDEKPSPEEIAEKKELEELEAAGFKDWTRNDYSRFIKSAEKNGRDKLNDIAEDLLGTKTLEEVTTYSEAFWRLGPTHIGDWEKVSKKIEEGEKKIAEKSEMATLLTHKVKSAGDNPWDNLTLKYGNNRGKLFNEEEDRFLLCMTDKLGYGRWEELKREVRLRPEFRFDWLFKSRTPIELGRRVDLLIREKGSKKQKVEHDE
ncbi:hypothetical protein EMIHUDRAFT_447960 [Emiliania huxleyi CCMP1516]|uniref:Uncharacterized protein n=3 Tax=Emiliania huxleyi TaxID=2903 RepID=A0A0D3J3S0_EMIH1|nr:hypothetical protein EMIHUDRAFT_447960 [Emiliania huxleyi CCMP1516]EOD18155.1 hypothetical protein EMIHUDRAFT_447960 [Emiliania huxleyi CCMP1516]|eukprot:XP_005770584.1 hypothetical protein EMIHUDRAFT_447960 [Emiliania huxleyi CCMP1516]